jgi:hypothetical protein
MIKAGFKVANKIRQLWKREFYLTLKDGILKAQIS